MKDSDYIWKDPMVKERLKEGASADDIALLRCPECEKLSYFNESAHFTCIHCEVVFYVCDDDEEAPEGVPFVRLDAVVSLADTVDDEGNMP